MKNEVATAIQELQSQFAPSPVTANEDGQGGAYVFLENVSLSAKFRPDRTWVGFHIPAQYPYADIYPIFISNDVARTDGRGFTAPVTPGHNFHGRPALQVSRRSSSAQAGTQKATSKVLKVLHFLETLE